MEQEFPLCTYCGGPIYHTGLDHCPYCEASLHPETDVGLPCPHCVAEEEFGRRNRKRNRGLLLLLVLLLLVLGWVS